MMRGVGRRIDRKGYGGFSLLEIMYTLLILTLLLTMGLPAWQRFYDKNQVLTVASKIKQIILLSNAEAKAVGSVLKLIPFSEQNNWSFGMLLIKGKFSSTRRRNANVIHTWVFEDTKIRVEWHGFQSNHFLQFAPHSHSMAINGYFVIKGVYHKQKLILNRTGRIQSVILS